MRSKVLFLYGGDEDMISRTSKLLVSCLFGAMLSFNASAQVDNFDPQSSILTSPLLQSGGYVFSNARIALPPGGAATLLSIGPVVGMTTQPNQFTSFDPATNSLLVPVFRMGNSYQYFNNAFLSVPPNNSWALNSLGDSFIQIGDTSSSSSGGNLTVSPATLTGTVGGTQLLTLIGGTPPYYASSSNSAVADLLPGAVTPSGALVQVNLRSTGTSVLTLWDSVASAVKTVTVTAQAASGGGATTQLSLSPASVSGVAGTNVTVIVQGSNNATVYVSNPSVASCSATAGASNPITCQLLSAGDATLTVVDAATQAVASGKITVTAKTTVDPVVQPLVVTPTSYVGLVGQVLPISVSGGVPPYRIGGYNATVVTPVAGAGTFNFLLVNSTASLKDNATTIIIVDSAGTSVVITVSTYATFFVEPNGTPDDPITMDAGMSIHLYLHGGTPPFRQVRPLDPAYFLVQQLGEREFLVTIKSGNITWKGIWLTFQDATGDETSTVFDVNPSSATLSASNNALEGYVGDTLNVTVTGGAPPYYARSTNTNIVSVSIDQQSLYTAYASVKMRLLPYNGALPAVTTVLISDSQNSTLPIVVTVKSRTPPVVFG